MKPLYTITAKILALISSVAEKVGEVNAVHLNRSPMELRKKNRIKTIRASLEIEGNTLSIDQITDLLNNKRVLALVKDIIEVKNAIQVYDRLREFDPYSLKSLCRVHSLLMKDLVDYPGKLRTKSLGIVKGKEITHLAPPGSRVQSFMEDLFNRKNSPMLASG